MPHILFSGPMGSVKIAVSVWSYLIETDGFWFPVQFYLQIPCSAFFFLCERSENKIDELLLTLLHAHCCLKAHNKND